MKKAQTEIIGLMVLVILFIFVGIIYIMFAGNGDSEDATTDVVISSRVQNILDAFIQITPCTTTFPMDQMDKIIKDCHKSAWTGSYCGKPCVSLIKGTIEGMMSKYNNKQNYYFKITDPSGTVKVTAGKPCSSDTRKTLAGTERVVSDGVVLKLQMQFCIK